MTTSTAELAAIGFIRRRYRDRRKRCFELAWKTLVLDAIDPAGWLLVHGAVAFVDAAGKRLADTPYAHAWLRRDETVYDPVRDTIFAAEAYAEEYGASALVTYTQVEAARAFSEHQHAGPWVGDGWDTELLALDPRWQEMFRNVAE
jgi:hypothetical protein